MQHLSTTARSIQQVLLERLHCKKRLAIFLSPAGMSLTKLSLAGNNLIIPGQGGFGGLVRESR
jgi:hypothetical protein